jgi:kynurenine formamidase
MIKIQDLSSTMKNFCMDPNEIKIKHLNELESRRREAKKLGLRVSEVKRFEMDDYITASSHASTHVDAPWHFGPVIAGQPAKTIDQVPLEWCYGNGVLLDFSKIKKPGEAIFVKDIKNELERIDHTLKPMDIVLFRTGAEDYQDDPSFTQMASGLNRDSLMWLLDSGVKLIGTDAFTLDIPGSIMLEELQKGNKEAFFPVHFAGREKEYIHSEKLFNLKSLSRPSGFKVAIFPIKIEKASGGWTRAVAIEGDGILKERPRILDLSMPLMSESMEKTDTLINRFTHEEGARKLSRNYGISLKLLPRPDLWANEEISCSSHAGTHVNVSWHYDFPVEAPIPKTIDEIPLERFYGNGILLDFSFKKMNEPIRSIDILNELEKVGSDLEADDIVFIRSGVGDKFSDDPMFNEARTILSLDALLLFCKKGISMVASDSCSINVSTDEILQSQDISNIRKFVNNDIYRAEKLCNLKDLPRQSGFRVAMFPIKLEKCFASWTRAVAFL